MILPLVELKLGISIMQSLAQQEVVSFGILPLVELKLGISIMQK